MAGTFEATVRNQILIRLHRVYIAGGERVAGRGVSEGASSIFFQGVGIWRLWGRIQGNMDKASERAPNRLGRVRK